MSPPSPVDDLLGGGWGHDGDKLDPGAPSPILVPKGTPEAPRPADCPVPNPAPSAFQPAEPTVPPVKTTPRVDPLKTAPKVDATRQPLPLPWVRDPVPLDRDTTRGKAVGTAIGLTLPDGIPSGIPSAGVPAPAMDDSSLRLPAPSGSPSVSLSAAQFSSSDVPRLGLRFDQPSPLAQPVATSPRLRDFDSVDARLNASRLPDDAIGRLDDAPASRERSPMIALGVLDASSPQSPVGGGVDVRSKAPAAQGSGVIAHLGSPPAVTSRESVTEPLVVANVVPAISLQLGTAPAAPALPELPRHRLPVTHDVATSPELAVTTGVQRTQDATFVRPGIALETASVAPRPTVAPSIQVQTESAAGLAVASSGRVPQVGVRPASSIATSVASPNSLASTTISQAAQDDPGASSRRETAQRNAEEERRVHGSTLRRWLQDHCPFFF